jgi:hypothetical protein
MGTTLITHIYNEEYLLPFWLNHHKDIFDNLVVIDYNSTDNSIKLCSDIWPNCKVITTRNDDFNAENVDKEIMDIENDIEGIKMVLNTTEFLICHKPIKELFLNKHISVSVKTYSPYSKKYYYPKDNVELFNLLLNDDVRYHTDRSDRQIHNFKNGNYTLGRHATYNEKIETNELYVIWFGYFPMNEYLINRKLQIQSQIPQGDKNNGFGTQHITTKENIMSINEQKVNDGSILKMINNDVNDILLNYNYKEGFSNNNYNYSYIIILLFLLSIFIVVFMKYSYKKIKPQYVLFLLSILLLLSICL